MRAEPAGDRWTRKQMLAIEYLAAGDETIEDIAEEIGVTRSTIWRWRKNPLFTEAVLVRAREMVKEELPQVYSALRRNARGGDARHIKILLDHVNEIEDRDRGYSSGSITFTWKDTWDEDDSVDQSNE